MKQKEFYMASEFGFRPCKIEDLKGQPKVQKMLQIYIKAAQIKKESFPNWYYCWVLCNSVFRSFD